MSATIDILIPAINNSYFTCSLIKSIKANTKIHYKIIYIDNGSNIKEFEQVAKILNEANLNYLIVRNNHNLGFVKAINQGLKLSNSEYICFQNNDTLIFEDCFERLIQHLKENNNSGIISPLASPKGGKQAIEIIQSLYTWFDNEIQQIDINKISHEETNKVIYEKYKGRVLEMNRSLAFFSVVMHRNTFNKVGYLDERYGLGLYDDDDYCQRIVAQNLKLFLALDVYVWHLASTTFKKMYSSNEFMRKMLENQKVFEAKWNK